jgi:hypothetical protein
MQYLLLIYFDEQALSETERQACYMESTQLAHEIKASGQYVAANPLHPTVMATTVRVRDGKRFVTDGPFAETRELIAGYWIWKVKSMEEAIEWAKRIPNDPERPDMEGEIELRPIFEVEDFGPELSPEMRKLEERLRTKAEKLNQS